DTGKCMQVEYGTLVIPLRNRDQVYGTGYGKFNIATAEVQISLDTVVIGLAIIPFKLKPGKLRADADTIHNEILGTESNVGLNKPNIAWVHEITFVVGNSRAQIQHQVPGPPHLVETLSICEFSYANANQR